MQILWNKTSRSTWDAAHAQLSATVQQDWAYGASMQAAGLQVHRAEVKLGEHTVALAQFVCRRYFGLLGIALCTRGPLWLSELAPEVQARIYQALKRSLPLRRLRLILFSPALSDPLDASLAGLTRVLTGYATVQIKLTQSATDLRASLGGYWRNRLVAAEKSGLVVVAVDSNSRQYQALQAEETQHRARQAFYALPLAFTERYIQAHGNAEQSVLILQAEANTPHALGTKPAVAAMLFLLHGSSATYHWGWSNAQGREMNAHNLLLWQAMLMLQARGIELLDLGGVNTRDLPGISRFKMNTGGQLVVYAGGYI